MQDIFKRQARLVLDILEKLKYTTRDNKPFFALKGGSALNYFVQPFPRLSVNIDLAFCPLDDRDTALANMNKGLQRLEQYLKTDFAGMLCAHKQSAGVDKLFVRHHSVTVKVEPNGVLRGTVFPSEMRPLCAEAQTLFQKNVMARCLSEADLYGGKICAALDRQHPRDLFDILPLMQTDALEDKTRKAFLVYALSHPRPLAELLDPRPQPLERIFVTEFSGMTRDPVALEKLEEARAWLLQAVQTGLTLDERHFLMSCKAGEPDWSLAGLPAHVPQLPAIRWKLHNITELRKQQKKYSAARAKLETCLFANVPSKESPELTQDEEGRCGPGMSM